MIHWNSGCFRGKLDDWALGPHVGLPWAGAALTVASPHLETATRVSLVRPFPFLGVFSASDFGAKWIGAANE
jgi:hypothetical protein